MYHFVLRTPKYDNPAFGSQFIIPFGRSHRDHPWIVLLNPKWGRYSIFLKNDQHNNLLVEQLLGGLDLLIQIYPQLNGIFTTAFFRMNELFNRLKKPDFWSDIIYYTGVTRLPSAANSLSTRMSFYQRLMNF